MLCKTSIEPKINIITNKIIKHILTILGYLIIIPRYPNLDNKLSCNIEHIDVKNCNNEYIKYLFVVLDINLTIYNC